ncbi:MAG: hypothetical protein WD993_00660 [Thermoleophilaceae bacterium]
MRDPDRIKRYALVPRAPAKGGPDGVRRFSLARVAPSPRSALGIDRHERLERIADLEGKSSNGGDPASEPQEPAE